MALPAGRTDRRDLGRPRRRLSCPARTVRRGRHGPGAAGARQRALRRRRRARVGGRHGQGGDEDALRRHRLPIVPHVTVLRREWQAGRARDHGARRAGASVSGLRQAGQPRIERRHLEGDKSTAELCEADGPGAASSTGRSSSRPACRMRARSSARCSATTTRKRRFLARSS